jgi:signal recognition particle subunit SRP54
VNLRVVRRFVNRTIEEARGRKFFGPSIPLSAIRQDRLRTGWSSFSGRTNRRRLKRSDTLSVVLMMGLQGSGKTTTAGNIAAFTSAREGNLSCRC